MRTTQRKLCFSAILGCFWLIMSSSPSNATGVKKLYDGQRVTRSLFAIGNDVIFTEEQSNVFHVINSETGESLPLIPAASAYPGIVFSGAHGDLIGVSFNGNLATVINGTTFRKKGDLDLGGYVGEDGSFVPYWMSDGCMMPNGDLYFVGFSDVALVRVRAGSKKAELVATQDTAGLSGSTEIACSGGKLFIANHRSMLDPNDDQILVLSTQGVVLEQIPMPGLMHMKASGNTLVMTTTSIGAAPGSVQFGNTSGDKLKIESVVRNDHYPQMIAFDEAGGKVLIAEKTPAAFATFSTTSFRQLSRKTFSAADGITIPRGIAVSGDGNTVFIESNGSVWAVH